MQIDKKDSGDVSILKTENIETAPFKEGINSKRVKRKENTCDDKIKNAAIKHPILPPCKCSL